MKITILGASGGFGSAFARLLGPIEEVELRGASRRPPRRDGGFAAYHTGDPTAPGATLRECYRSTDLLLACLPPEPCLRALEESAELLPEGACFADILSVKQPLVAAYEAARPDLELISLHPMFASDLGFAGRKVVWIEPRAGSHGRRLRGWLEEAGAELVDMDLAAHDRCTAAVQVATHAATLAFGCALRALGHDLAAGRAIATPPHAALLGALERVVAQDASVYWDIQCGHPRGHEVRTALVEAAATIDAMVDGGDQAAFHAALEEVRAWMQDA